MSVPDSGYARVVFRHTGRRDPPRPVAKAIRAMTRAQPDNAAVWLLAARCLAHTGRVRWAYRCYRRAARLKPQDLAVAEEAGMFGVYALGVRDTYTWSRYLHAARVDPTRRHRIDPVLLAQAGSLPALVAMLLACFSLFGMMVGGLVVRGDGHGLDGPLPVGVTPRPGIVGVATALAVTLGLTGLIWLMMRPVKRFGADIVRRTFAWPLALATRVTIAASLLTTGYTVTIAGFAGDVDTFPSLIPWVLLGLLITSVLGFVALAKPVSSPR